MTTPDNITQKATSEYLNDPIRSLDEARKEREMRREQALRQGGFDAIMLGVAIATGRPLL